MSYLENMRKGEEARDATPKIRGFLFQDYYTIELLLDDNIKWIKVEYIEDIIFKKKNNHYHIVQAKYTHDKNISNKISSEAQESLYYQFLKSKLFNDNNTNISFDLLSTSKTHIPFSSNQLVSEPIDLKSLKSEFLQNIYNQNLESRMAFIFEKMNTKTNFNEFQCNFIQRNTIEDYKEELEKKLSEKYSLDGELLFFVSYGYIQKYGYLDKDKIIYREDFNTFITELINGKKEDEKVLLILISYIDSVYSDVLDSYAKSKDLDTKNLDIYQEIFTQFKNYVDINFLKTLEISITCSKKDSKDWIIVNQDSIFNWIKEIWKILYNYIYEEQIELKELNLAEILIQNHIFELSNFKNENAAFLTQINESRKSKERSNLFKFFHKKNYYPDVLFIRNQTNKEFNYILDISKADVEENYDFTNAEIPQLGFCHCKKCITIDDDEMFFKDNTNNYFKRGCCKE